MRISRRLADVLRCPRCGGKLSQRRNRLVCQRCSGEYRFVYGVPDMRIKECLKWRNAIQRIAYNAVAPFYDRLIELASRLLSIPMEEVKQEIVQSLEIEPGNTVLDVSIGSCEMVPLYRKRTRASIYGVDISEGMLALCLRKIRAWGYTGVHLVLGCAERLPFKDESFDRVLISGSFSHFQSPRRALEEATRVVKRGGIVVVFDQLLAIDRWLRRDCLPLLLKPQELKLLGQRYVQEGMFFITKFERKE